METKFQTSFIPKTTLQAPNRLQRSTPYSIFVLTSFLIFLGSLLIAVGSFFYLKFLENSKVSLEEDLNKNIEKIERETIEEYARFDRRIETASSILKNHIAVSNFLQFLSEKTLKTVRFENLDYDLSEDGNYANISMKGVASSYNSVAHQANVFGENKELVAPIFSDLDLDKDGNVTFTFTSRINSNFIYYSNVLDDQVAVPATQTQSTGSQNSVRSSNNTQSQVSSDDLDADIGSLDDDLNLLDQSLTQ